MMPTRTRPLDFALLTCGVILASPGDALAYIDPGTGSYLFQIAAAGLLAGLFTVRRYWELVKSVFRRGPGSSDSSPHRSE